MKRLLILTLMFAFFGATALMAQTPFNEPRHLWIAVDLAKPETAIRDAINNRMPRVAWGNPLTVHVAFYDGADLVDDFTGLETLYLEIDETRTNEAGTPLVLEDVAVGSVDDTLTAEQWAARTNEHATFTLTAAQLQTTQRNLAEKKVWWILHAARDDDAPLLLGMGEVTVYSTNATPTDTPAPALAELYPTPSDIVTDGDLIRLGAVPQIVPETHAADHVDRRIAGLTANNSTKLIWSTLDHATPAYVWSTTCWAADIDLTAVSVWNSVAAGAGGGILISPRHILLAWHYTSVRAPGTTFRFVAADGTVTTRTLSSVSQVGSDLCIGLLDSAVPATITPAKVLPEGWDDSMTTAVFPVMYIDQEKKALLRDAHGDGVEIAVEEPVEAQRLTFSEMVVGGDSGSPVALIVDGALCVLGHISMPVGDDVAANAASINAAMTALGGGYQLTPVGFPATPPTIPYANITDAPSPGDVSVDVIWDAAGDLVVGTGANTAARLAKGAPLTGLRVNAGGTALEWAGHSNGDVVGPGSSPSNGLAIYSGTTGKLLTTSSAVFSGTMLSNHGLIDANDGSGGHSIRLDPDNFRIRAEDGFGGGVRNISLSGTGDLSAPATAGTIALTTTNFPASQITSGTLDDARIPSGIARDSEVSAAYQPLDTQLTDLAGLAYATNALKVVRVNSGATAFELATLAGGGDALVADPLSQFAATTSAQLAGVISDETGTGAVVLATSPTLVAPNLGTPASGTLTNATGLPIDAGTTGTLPIARGGTGATTAASARTALGLVIGTDVQAYDADLTTYAGITPAANTQTLLAGADYAAWRSNLGLVVGTNVQAYDADLTTYAGITPAANTQTLLAGADYAAWRSNLGLVIGTNVQAYDVDLDDLADGSLSGSKVGTGIDGVNVTAGTVADARIDGALTRDTEWDTMAEINAASTDTDAVLDTDIGATVQAYDGDLDDLAALTPTKGKLVVGNGTDWISVGVGTNDHVLTADSAQASGVKWAAAAGGGGGPTIVYTTGDQSVGSTSLADATGLTYSLAANEQIDFVARLRIVASVSTEAPRPAVNGPAGLVYLTAGANWCYAITTTQEEPILAYETAAAFTQSSTSERLLTVSGTLINGATSGTFAIRIATETGGANSVTVKAGSSLTVHSE